MYLQGRHVDLLGPDDITRVVENKVQESRSLDYKLELNLKLDSDKKEFVVDVASMANTEGGCFIYGIGETKDEKGQNTGTPDLIAGVVVENHDKLKQQVEDLIRGNTDPNISNIGIKFIEVSGKLVLVIGVSRIFGLPVMVTSGGANKFYRRRNSGKYAVDVYELNQLFMQNAVWKKSADDFRKERIEKVLRLEVFPNLYAPYPFFIHIIPFSFQDGPLLDLSQVAGMSVTGKMRPLQLGGYDTMYNLDGFATWNGKLKAPFNSYDQLFRNGVYEAYTTDFINEMAFNNGQKLMAIQGFRFMGEVQRKIKEALSVLQEFRVEPPFILMISMLNTRDAVIFMETLSNWTRPFLASQIFLPAVVIPTYETAIGAMLKPQFDILWQCASENQSPI
jgi:hypothetical protein